jgi:hypothetical protein
MSRFLVLALLIGGAAACGNGSKSAGEQQKTPPGSEERIAVPGAKGSTEGAAVGGASDGSRGATTGAVEPLTQERYDKAVANAQFHLKPEEGTLTMTKAEGKAGTVVAAEVKLAPGAGFHVSTDYPTKLKLMTVDGVKLEKAVMTAGGSSKSQGDAATLTEQQLAFAVKLTPEKTGAYEVKGVFSFGVCEADSCHPRTQPITIQVAAN